MSDAFEEGEVQLNRPPYQTPIAPQQQTQEAGETLEQVVEKLIALSGFHHQNKNS